MRLVRRVFALVVFVGLLVGGWHFAADNSGLVTIYHLAGETGEIALWKVLLVAFGSGAGIAMVLGWVREARVRLVSRRYRKAIVGLEAEVHQLRSLPLSEGAAMGSSELGVGKGVERSS
jgi:uncharacterized integral membrane protein